MNEHSSRSHLMLSVVVESANRISGGTTWGKLHLVDLAGSERISKSGAAGQALKEAQAINKSLSALGDVIMSRAQKSAHVPFRNSTLTHLLQASPPTHPRPCHVPSHPTAAAFPLGRTPCRATRRR